MFVESPSEQISKTDMFGHIISIFLEQQNIPLNAPKLLKLLRVRYPSAFFLSKNISELLFYYSRKQPYLAFWGQGHYYINDEYLSVFQVLYNENQLTNSEKPCTIRALLHKYFKLQNQKQLTLL